MKRIVMAAGSLMLVALLGMVGCEKGSDDAPAGTAGDQALVGNWKMTAMSVNGGGFFPPSNIGWDVQVQLNGDGTLSATEVWQGDREQGNGGWSAGGGRMNMQTPNYNWLGSYTATADTFQLTDVPNYDGQGHTGSFEFTRQ